MKWFGVDRKLVGTFSFSLVIKIKKFFKKELIILGILSYFLLCKKRLKSRKNVSVLNNLLQQRQHKRLFGNLHKFSGVKNSILLWLLHYRITSREMNVWYLYWNLWGCLKRNYLIPYEHFYLLKMNRKKVKRKKNEREQAWNAKK